MRFSYWIALFLLLSKIACFQSTCWGQCYCVNEDYVCVNSGKQSVNSGNSFQDYTLGRGYELDRQYYVDGSIVESRCDLQYDLTLCAGINNNRPQTFGSQIGISLGTSYVNQITETCPGQTLQDIQDNSSIDYNIYAVVVSIKFDNSAGTNEAMVKIENAENHPSLLYEAFDNTPGDAFYLINPGQVQYADVYLYGTFFNVTQGPAAQLPGTIVDSFDVPDMDDRYVYGGKQNYWLDFNLVNPNTFAEYEECTSNCDQKVDIEIIGYEIWACAIGVEDCAGTPTSTPTPSNTPGIIPFTPTPSNTPTPTNTKSPTPSWTPTNTVNPSDTATSTWTPSPTPTATNTTNPTHTATPTNTNIIPTVVATPGANTYNLCLDAILPADDNMVLNDTLSIIGYDPSESGLENVNFLRFRVPNDSVIAADNVRIKTAKIQWQSSRRNLSTAQTLGMILTNQANFLNENWYDTDDLDGAPVIDFETYVAPAFDLSNYTLTFDITQVVPLNGANYKGNKDTFFYFALRSEPAAEGDTTEKAIDGITFPSLCSAGTLPGAGDAARIVFTYDTDNTAPTPPPTLTPLPTATINSDSVYYSMPISTRGPYGSDGSIPPTIANDRIGWWNETEWATYKQEMLTYPMTITIDTNNPDESQYWYTGEGTKYDRVLLKVDFLQEPSSEGGSMDVMVVGSQSDPRVSFGALQTALVMGRGTLQDTGGVQSLTFNVTGIFPDILAEADLDDSYYITIMPDTRGFYTGQSFRVANVDFDLYWSDPDPTATATQTFTPSETFTPSNTPTITNTPIPTATNTPIPPTNTPTNTLPGPTATFTPTNTATRTNTPTATNTPTNTPTGLFKPLLGVEGTTGVIQQNPVSEIDSLLVEDTLWGVGAEYKMDSGWLRMPYNLADAVMYASTLAITSDATASIRIANSDSSAIFSATMENPDATAEIALGTDKLVFSATDVNFNGIGFGPSTNAAGAIVMKNGTARDGEIYWKADENALYFGDFAKEDVDVGMDIEGRMTNGSSTSPLTTYFPPACFMPDIASAASDFDTITTIIGPVMSARTTSATHEIVSPCPWQANGTYVDSVRVYARMEGSDLLSVTIKSKGTDGSTTDLVTFGSVTLSSLTNLGGPNYYTDITIDHTISNESIVAYIEIYRAAATATYCYGTHWTFNETVR